MLMVLLWFLRIYKFSRRWGAQLNFDGGRSVKMTIAVSRSVFYIDFYVASLTTLCSASMQLLVVLASYAIADPIGGCLTGFLWSEVRFFTLGTPCHQMGRGLLFTVSQLVELTL